MSTVATNLYNYRREIPPQKSYEFVETIKIWTVHDIPQKIAFTRDRIKKFRKWECEKHLAEIKDECIVKLKNQLCFLKQVKFCKRAELKRPLRNRSLSNIHAIMILYL